MIPTLFFVYLNFVPYRGQGSQEDIAIKNEQDTSMFDVSNYVCAHSTYSSVLGHSTNSPFFINENESAPTLPTTQFQLTVVFFVSCNE